LATSARLAAATSVASPATLLAQGGPGVTTSEKLNLVIIGVGGRGGANTSGVGGQHIVALCDVNPGPLEKVQKQFPDARLCTDWREIVNDAKVDDVVISTADHHHTLCAIGAMRANKHVYCEKPLAHTVREARLMQDEYLKRRGTIATQMGTQMHAGDNFRRVVELVQVGAVGPIREVHVWCNRGINAVNPALLPEQPVPEGFDWDVWLGPAAARPYNEGYWRGGNLNWNRRWEFGNGVVGDMGSHLIDLPFWALQLRRPVTVESVGPSVDPDACPPWQQITWEHAARGNGPHLQSCKVHWYHGDEGMKRRAAYLQPQVGSDTDIGAWGIGVAFVGDDGLLMADYDKLVLSPAAKFKEYPLPEHTIPVSLGHYAEWIHAAKTGGESLCNCDYSGALVEHNLLGNVAHRVGKKLEWDADALSVTNVPEANDLLTKTYRDGWKV